MGCVDKLTNQLDVEDVGPEYLLFNKAIKYAKPNFSQPKECEFGNSIEAHTYECSKEISRVSSVRRWLGFDKLHEMSMREDSPN